MRRPDHKVPVLIGLRNLAIRQVRRIHISRRMRIAIAGGGPGGLYLSILLKRLDPASEVVVHERNAPDDTFGFGVVFSDETLGGIEHADPAVVERMREHTARWDDIDVHHRGTTTTSGGHGFSAMSRKELLRILQEQVRCQA